MPQNKLDYTNIRDTTYDDAKPTSYMRCTVVGVTCVENKLEVTVRNPVREQIQEIAEEPPIGIQ